MFVVIENQIFAEVITAIVASESETAIDNYIADKKTNFEKTEDREDGGFNVFQNDEIILQIIKRECITLA